ncbi:hypothetical protein JVX98_25685 [Ensifer sp. PDNC004]|uniref:hypothetical protein n=1 Tax=Ensifer sp. PDNC004 TaxID=2811423 RepID=UPI0019632433|nr:hypothetical protein [Ensifer sp. PDNC004]QRY67704.1 hypothetical protein JVX98_25685 [Ensifer sp. PDNC004]
MFERPPFKDCGSCGQQSATGIVWISPSSFKRRCKFCKVSTSHPLPDLDKQVLYLDQFAITAIFQTKTGKLAPGAHHAKFWSEASGLLDRAIMRQQIICPASNIHRDETIVHYDSEALGLAHEMLGGDTSFENTTQIEHDQIFDYLDAYLKGQNAPRLEFNVDEILHGSRNAWLQDIHITAQMDWSAFVEDTRRARDDGAANLVSLYDRWATERPTFEQVLSHELSDAFATYIGGYLHFMSKAAAAMKSGDNEGFMQGALAPVVSLIHEINRVFTERGIPEAQALKETAKFFAWPQLQTLPAGWVSAHLFAAIADRLAKGQKRYPTRGMSNDIKVISVYGPYVDAMFLDNECADLLQQKSVAKGVNLKARIFCLKRKDEFLQYLQDLGDAAPVEVVEASRELYGDLD